MLTVTDYLRLATECIVDVRTVKRAYAGDRCTSTTIERLGRAAEKLGLPPPPARESKVA